MLSLNQRIDADTADFLVMAEQEGLLAPLTPVDLHAPPRWRDYGGFADWCTHQLFIVDMRGNLVPLRPNWMQRQIILAELRARRAGKKPWFIILKYRKGGVTTLEQAFGYWDIWRKPHGRCLTLAHAPADTRDIFHMVELYWLNQPEEFRHPKSGARTTWIELPGWDGLYRSGTAGRTSIARGATLGRVHLSEAAQYADLPAIHSSVTDTLREDGAYVIESTAFGQEGRGEAFHKYWDAARAGQSEFIPLFFPWHADPSKRHKLLSPDEMDPLSNEEQELMEVHSLSLEQMKWWRGKRRELLAEGGRSARGDIIHQEHPSDDETCFLLGTGGYYDPDMLKACRALCVEPISIEENGRLRIFEEPEENGRYVVGCDVAEGIGADDSTAVCFNSRTGRQAFTWASNQIPPDEFGRTVLGSRTEGLGYRYKNTGTNVPAYMMIERNNHGHATLTGLLKMAEYPHEAVYHHFDPTKDDPSETESLLAGWPHGGTSHVHLQSEIGRMIREHDPLILDERVVKSIQAVGIGKSGADFGGRDLAVGAGLGALALPHAKQPEGYAYIGGRIVKM